MNYRHKKNTRTMIYKIDKVVHTKITFLGNFLLYKLKNNNKNQACTFVFMPLFL